MYLLLPDSLRGPYSIQTYRLNLRKTTLYKQALILHIFMDYVKTPYKYPDRYDSSIIFLNTDVSLFGATSQRAPLSS